MPTRAWRHLRGLAVNWPRTVCSDDQRRARIGTWPPGDDGSHVAAHGSAPPMFDDGRRPRRVGASIGRARPGARGRRACRLAIAGARVRNGRQAALDLAADRHGLGTLRGRRWTSAVEVSTSWLALNRRWRRVKRSSLSSGADGASFHVRLESTPGFLLSVGSDSYGLDRLQVTRPRAARPLAALLPRQAGSTQRCPELS